MTTEAGLFSTGRPKLQNQRRIVRKNADGATKKSRNSSFTRVVPAIQKLMILFLDKLADKVI